MEFLVVLFPHKRPVKLDGKRIGSTNQILMLETGIHQVTLDGALDFKPREVDVTVVNTSALTPMTVQFTPNE